jgi:2-haloacid dehalogenase
MTPKPAPSKPSIVVFDLGGVLVDWDPRRLMNQVISDVARREDFLSKVVTAEFLLALDVASVSRDGVAPALRRHPEFAEEIAAYIERFPEMISGEFPAMVEVVHRLHAADVPLFGLTNWAGDTFNLMRPRLPTLALLRDIVVSGHEGLVKPDHRIFALLCQRGGFAAADAVFIDDSLRNVEAASAFGMAAIHHRSADQTIEDLNALGLPA